MSEKSPRLIEYEKVFGPRERAEAVIFKINEYIDQAKNLSQEKQAFWESKLNALSLELHKDEKGDEELILGYTSELIKFLDTELGCSKEELTHDNLMKYRRAHLDARFKEIGSEGGVQEEQDPFAPPKKKEYKN